MTPPTDSAKRDRDRRHDAKRRAEKPWLAWYKTTDWHRLRARQLKARPWCQMCLKRGDRTTASVVDHVERHNGDRNKFFRGALQSLCAHCHNAVKQSHERGNRAGCDVTGMPIDPKHPWSG